MSMGTPDLQESGPSNGWGSTSFRLRLQARIQLHRLYQVIQMERTTTLRRIQKEAAEVNGGDFNDR